MSVEENKELARRIVEEVFSHGNVSVADELMAPNFVEREDLPLPPETPRNRESAKQMASMLHRAFPDFKATIDDVIAEGDKVVIRWTCTGTQKGELMGVPPTGRRISVGVIDILRMAGGKCVEHWGQFDAMRMMQQLGVVPEPQRARSSTCGSLPLEARWPLIRVQRQWFAAVVRHGSRDTGLHCVS